MRWQRSDVLSSVLQERASYGLICRTAVLLVQTLEIWTPDYPRPFEEALHLSSDVFFRCWSKQWDAIFCALTFFFAAGNFLGQWENLCWDERLLISVFRTIQGLELMWSDSSGTPHHKRSCLNYLPLLLVSLVSLQHSWNLSFFCVTRGYTEAILLLLVEKQATCYFLACLGLKSVGVRMKIVKTNLPFKSALNPLLLAPCFFFWIVVFVQAFWENMATSLNCSLQS